MRKLEIVPELLTKGAQLLGQESPAQGEESGADMSVQFLCQLMGSGNGSAGEGGYGEWLEAG